LRLTGRRFNAIVFMAIAIVVAGVAGCGGSDDSTTTVTSTVTAPSGSTGVTTYTGTTEQGLPISFSATSDAVVEISFGWRAPCADGQVRSNSISLGGGPIHDETFSFGGVLETGGVAQVEGTIDGDTASGTFSRSKGTAFGIDCKVTDVSWEADAGAGQGAAS
jgi:hypothetical protein